MNKYLISVDMGGTKILASVINSKEGIISREKKPTKIEDGQTAYETDLVSIINSVIEKSKLHKNQIAGIAIGVPGSVNPHTGVIGLAPNLGLENYNIKEMLGKHFDFPILVENDVNLAALGISSFGVAINHKNVLVVFIGTGIGSGIILDGKIYRGSNYFAGEIGHIPVKMDGPLCGCGKKGCFEALASRTAVVNNITSDINKGKESTLAELLKSGKRIKSGALKNAVKSDDQVVTKRLSESCDVIGWVLAGQANMMNFDMIILGGGVIEALKKFMLPKIISSFDNYVLKDSGKDLKIVASKLGDDAAIYGGIPLAKEFLNIDI